MLLGRVCEPEALPGRPGAARADARDLEFHGPDRAETRETRLSHGPGWLDRQINPRGLSLLMCRPVRRLLDVRHSEHVNGGQRYTKSLITIPVKYKLGYREVNANYIQEPYHILLSKTRSETTQAWISMRRHGRAAWTRRRQHFIGLAVSAGNLSLSGSLGWAQVCVTSTHRPVTAMEPSLVDNGARYFLPFVDTRGESDVKLDEQPGMRRP